MSTNPRSVHMPNWHCPILMNSYLDKYMWIRTWHYCQGEPSKNTRVHCLGCWPHHLFSTCLGTWKWSRGPTEGGKVSYILALSVVYFSSLIFRYCNMDFIALSAVIRILLIWLVITYDIGCQWSKNIYTWMEELVFASPVYRTGNIHRTELDRTMVQSFSSCSCPHFGSVQLPVAMFL